MAFSGGGDGGGKKLEGESLNKQPKDHHRCRRRSRSLLFAIFPRFLFNEQHFYRIINKRAKIYNHFSLLFISPPHPRSYFTLCNLLIIIIFYI